MNAPVPQVPEPQETHRCSCGFESEAICALEDHLFVFPEDDHYELARDWPRDQR